MKSLGRSDFVELFIEVLVEGAVTDNAGNFQDGVAQRVPAAPAAGASSLQAGADQFGHADPVAKGLLAQPFMQVFRQEDGGAFHT